MLARNDFFKLKDKYYICFQGGQGQITVIDLEENVCKYFSIEPEDIKVILRENEVTEALEKISIGFDGSKDVKIGDFVKFYEKGCGGFSGFIFQFSGNDYEIVGNEWNLYISNQDYKNKENCTSAIPSEFALKYLIHTANEKEKNNQIAAY